MIAGSLESLDQGGFNVVMGASLANILGVEIGDHIDVTVPRLTVTPLGVFPRSKRLAVTGGRFATLPDAGSNYMPLATALAAFGIIGVGANELIAYPYWCIEKGYPARIGHFDNTKEWERRAHGWLRVLRTDVWVTLIILTAATIPFYFLGD